MKHPVLTRVFAIVLAILCLVMLLAGLFGLRSADRERQRALEDAGRLQSRAAEYENALQELEGGEPYQQLNARLERHQAEHDKLLSRHRSEMAMYTATQSGLRTGASALDQADAAMAEGRRQYEAGLAAFEEQARAFAEQYAQFQNSKKQLADYAALYYAAVEVLTNAEWHAGNARNMTELLDGEDPEARRELTLDAYNGALSAVDQVEALIQTIKELTPTLDAIAAMDENTLNGLTEMGQFGDLAGTDVQMPEIDMDQVRQIKQVYDEAWPQIKALIAQMDEQMPALEQAVQDATGKSISELRADAAAQRDAIAAGDEETPMTDEEFELVRAAYGETREQILSVLGSADALLARLRALADQIGALLAAVQAKIAEADAMLEQGKAAIEQGRAALEEAGRQIEEGEKALYESRTMIWWQMGQQREKAARLQYEKKRLDVEAVQLKDFADAVEYRKQLEQDERSLRLMLLKREAVETRYDAGMALADAAVSAADEAADAANENWKGRMLSYLLLIAGGIVGFLGLPAAFEKTKSRFLLLAPVLLCLLCAAGAEALCLYLGRGSSYSALAAGIFALIQFLISAPKVKHPAN